MRISKVMSPKVATASTRTNLLAISRTMSKKKISCVIINGKDRPLGIISERDTVRHVASNEGDLEGITAG
jgi:CBS domain-containing protein